jgi:serine/threonine protein phosphatase PrpC
MHSMAVIILLVFVAQPFLGKAVANEHEQDSISNVVDRVVGKLVDKLLVRGIQTLPLDQKELDKTTLRKPSKPNTSRGPAAPLNMHDGHATWKHGLSSQQLVKASATAAAPPPTAAAAAAAGTAAPSSIAPAAQIPRVASSVALRGRDVSGTFRTGSICGLQCDFSGRSAFEKPLSLTYLYEQEPLNAIKSPWKTSCEFEGECTNLPFESSAVGTYSYQGMKPSQRRKSVNKINQDRGSVAYPFAGNPQQAFFAVYDGHGDGGEKVSEHTMRILQDALEKNPRLVGDVPAALEAAFIEADRQVLAWEKFFRQVHHRGTTALVALMRDNKVWVANAGDSRCVLASKWHASNGMPPGIGDRMGLKVKDLSTDQKPNSPGEQERIERSGGFVRLPDSPGLPGRVYPPDMVDENGDEYGGLAMSRSIGDYAVKKFGVTASPEVKAYTLGSDDLFMILASDGIWEFIPSQEAAEIVWDVLQEGGDATKATEMLVEVASERWRKEEGNYRDDITAIVITLPLFKQVAERDLKASPAQNSLEFPFEHLATEIRDLTASQSQRSLGSGPLR